MSKLYLKQLSWDSTFFKKKISSLIITEENFHIEDLHRIFENSNDDLIYVFSNAENIPKETLLKYNGHLVDKKIVFSSNIHKGAFSKNVSPFFEKKEELYSLSRAAGTYSRFRRDPNFTEEVFFRFYDKWIENSINKNIADIVMVYNDKNTIKGLITAKHDEKKATIGLFSVEQKSRGKGLGHELINHLFAYLNELGIRQLNVATQLENTNACSFYSKIGFKKSNITYIYHFWKNK